MTTGADRRVREAELEVSRSEIYLEICTAAVRRNRATKVAVWGAVVIVAALTLLSRNFFFMTVGLLAIAGGFVYAKNAKPIWELQSEEARAKSTLEVAKGNLEAAKEQQLQKFLNGEL